MDVEGDDEDHGAIAAAAVPTSWTRRKVMDAMRELGDGDGWFIWRFAEDAPPTDDKNFMLIALSITCGDNHDYIPIEDKRSDVYEIMRTRQSRYGDFARTMLLVDAAEDLKADHGFMLEAARMTRARALAHAAKELLEDRDFMLAVVRLHGCAYSYAASTLQEDHELALAAVTQDRGVLKVLSPSLQADHAILRAAHETVKGAKPENKEDREMRGTLLAMGYTEAQIESALASSWNSMQVAAEKLMEMPPQPATPSGREGAGSDSTHEGGW